MRGAAAPFPTGGGAAILAWGCGAADGSSFERACSSAFASRRLRLRESHDFVGRSVIGSFDRTTCRLFGRLLRNYSIDRASSGLLGQIEQRLSRISRRALKIGHPAASQRSDRNRNEAGAEGNGSRQPQPRDRLHGSSLFFERNHVPAGNHMRIPLGGVFRPQISGKQTQFPDKFLRLG